MRGCIIRYFPIGGRGGGSRAQMLPGAASGCQQIFQIRDGQKKKCFLPQKAGPPA
jgi:hypothetical protein